MEITQFTYFQQAGGIDLKPVSGEITYGLERITMYLQQAESVYDIKWNDKLTYGDVYHQNEVQFSRFNFEAADVPALFNLFEIYEKECVRIAEMGLPLPAYDYCLKCSHTFNLLDARSAISVMLVSVTERTSYIARVRALAKICAEKFVETRKSLGYPLLNK